MAWSQRSSLLPILLLGLVGTLSSPRKAWAEQAFYEGLAQAISHVDARLYIEFRTGTIVTIPVGQPHLQPPPGTAYPKDAIVWFIAPGTTAELSLSTDDGWLSSEASLAFSQPVDIDVAPDSQFGGTRSIKSIHFNSDGEPVTFVQPSGTPDPIPSQYAYVLRQLRLANRASELFTAHVFPNLLVWPPDASLLIERVGVQTGPSGDRTVPGLRVTLRQGAVVPLTPTPAANTANWIELDSGSEVYLDQLLYTPATGSVTGVLRQAVLNARAGHLEAPGLSLWLSPGSGVRLGLVEFQQGENNASLLAASDGVLHAAAGAGSSLTLSGIRGKRSVSFTVDDGTALTLLSLEFRADGKGSSVTCGGRSIVSIRILDGRLSLGGDNYLLLGGGAFVARLSRGKWTSAAGPELEGDMAFLSATVVGGEVALGTDGGGRNAAVVAEGRIRGTGLTISSATEPPIVGPLEVLDLELATGSHFDLPGKLLAVLREGGRIRAAAPAQVQLGSGKVCLYGGFVASIPFVLSELSENQTKQLRNGQLEVRISIDKDGSLVADVTILEGELKLCADFLGRTIEVVWHLLLTNGHWGEQDGKSILQADLSGEVGFHEVRGERHASPVRFELTLPECPLYSYVTLDGLGRRRFLVYPVELAITPPGLFQIRPHQVWIVGGNVLFARPDSGATGVLETFSGESVVEIAPTGFVEGGDEWNSLSLHAIHADCVTGGIDEFNDVWLVRRSYVVPLTVQIESDSGKLLASVIPRFPRVTLSARTHYCFLDKLAIVAGFYFDPASAYTIVNKYAPENLIPSEINARLSKTKFALPIP